MHGAGPVSLGHALAAALGQGVADGPKAGGPGGFADGGRGARSADAPVKLNGKC